MHWGKDSKVQNGLRIIAERDESRLTCSLGRCRLEAPSSTRWPQGPEDSCQREWGDSGHSCGPAGLLVDKQRTNINVCWRKATEATWTTEWPRQVVSGIL